MTTIGDLMERMRSLIERNKTEASATGAVYKFVIDGEGGGTFVVNLSDNPGVSEGDGVADCVIRMAVPDFVAMAEGRIDSRELFFAGRLRVDGDMGLALKLKKLRQAALQRE